MKSSNVPSGFFVIIWIFNLISFSVNGQDECSVSGLLVDVKKSPTSQYLIYPTRTICQLPEYYENEPFIATNIYGSRTDRQTTATGYYYVKQLDDRWWIVDPEGYLNICRAVNAIAQGTGSSSKNAFAEKFGSSTSWMDATKELLNDNGFYCAGAWSSNSSIIQNPNQSVKPLAYTIILNWMSSYGGNRTFQQTGHAGYPNDCIFVFEKGFADYCESKAQALAGNSSDKNLFGYFSDNELPFYNKSLNNFLRLGKASATNENYLATKKWLTENGFIEADTTNSDVQARFLGFVGETYFSIVYNAIKKYDPNHMYIGPRVNIAEARENKYFMQAVGKYVDILSVNYYSIWTPNSTSMNNWGDNLGKPFMVTEFYTKGEDSGLANTTGAGWIVKTQLERGYAYQNFTLALLESKNCVGWHWFKYFDNDPSIPDPEPSNIDGNKGIVNILYEPYTPLLVKMKELNLRVYNLIDYFDKRRPPLYIYPEADAYYKGSLNFGSEDRLGIKNTTDIPYYRESFLRFDLSGRSVNVVQVDLHLSVLRAGDPGITYLAEFVSDDTWTEGGITYENHPEGTEEIGSWKHSSDVVLDLKNYYLETLGSDKKLSLKLSATDMVVSQLEYASRENPSVGLRPRIEITEKENAPADDTKLSELIIGEKRVASFHPDTLIYNITLPAGTAVNPEILFYHANSASTVDISGPVNILSDSLSDRTAVINTTSADGLHHRTYTMFFKVANPVSSIGENRYKPDFVIYPNPLPVNTQLMIRSEAGFLENAKATIMDLSGKVLSEITLAGSGLVFNTRGLLPGIYIITIRNHKYFSSLKLIVK